jgi:hypothetical protein
VTLLLGLLFGFLQGLRHAFEPDHVVAVSTMISHQRGGRARVAYAFAWGIGHAVMLVGVGSILIVLRATLPARVDAAFELAVALMLIALGARAVHGAWRVATPHAEERRGGTAWGLRHAVGPLAMGMVHGLAGSGALTALVVARLPSPQVALVFMLLFGLGATLGMALLAGAAGVPLARLLRTRWGLPALLGATGTLSLGLGLVWVGPALARRAGGS